MSETKILKLKKHDNPATNEEEFDIENYLNGNWDNIEEYAEQVNAKITNIDEKDTEQDNTISEIKEKDTEQDNKIIELQNQKTELEAEIEEMKEDIYQSSIRGQASGENIHVEDSSGARCNISVEGNHEQEQPTLDNPTQITVVGNNINIYDENAETTEKYINAQGEEIIGSENDTFTKQTIINPAKQYVMSFTKNNSSYVRFSYYNGETFLSREVGNRNNYAFSVPDGCTKIDVRVDEKTGSGKYFEKLKIEEGSVPTGYSKYGQGSIKLTACNRNLFKETSNNKSMKTIYGAIVFGDYNIKSGKTYEISFDTNNNGGNVYINEKCFKSEAEFTNIACDGKRKYWKGKAIATGTELKTILIKAGATVTTSYNISNIVLKEYNENDTSTDYIEHQEQVYIIPTQKEMLKGDYIDFENEEEVHMWGKYTFTGEEDYQKSQTYSNDEYLCAYIPTPVINNIKIDGKGLSSHFNRIGDFATYQNEECVRITGQLQIRVLVSRLTENSVEGLKAYFKSQYDAGTPVTIYYELQTEEKLKFTDEQKEVAKELKNARTYKTETNIITDSKAIIKLDYAKDLETENKKTQKEIDEIKQLLSTTQTSAMLLDNLQKDVESEVE